MQGQEPSWSLTLPAGLPGGLEPSGHEETFLRFFLVTLAASSSVWPWGRFQGHPHMTLVSRRTGQMHLPLEPRWCLAGFSCGCPHLGQLCPQPVSLGQWG